MAQSRTRKAAEKTATSTAKKTAKKTTTKKTAKKATAKKSTQVAEPQDLQPAGELPEEDLEVRTALISGTTFTDIPVQYVERDGYGVFEGDIILGKAEDLQAGLAATAESATDTGQGLHVGIKPGTRVDAETPAAGAL